MTHWLLSCFEASTNYSILTGKLPWSSCMFDWDGHHMCDVCGDEEGDGRHLSDG